VAVLNANDIPMFSPFPRAALALLFALPLLALDSGEPAAAHRTITTRSRDAQRWFDAGLVHMYAFNIGEAREDFAKAAKADPTAAMPEWGLMAVETEDINEPTTPAGEIAAKKAYAASKTRAASPQERALIEATAKRFTTPGSMETKYRAFRTAMRAFVDRYPTDADGADQALDAGLLVDDTFADAQGSLTPEGVRMAADAERVHAVDPGNLGEHHYAIHFWEFAGLPARALPDAQYLAGVHYEPGESHLPHMAGHIYARLGMFDQMIAVNTVAIENDAVYFAQGDGPGQRYMRDYHDHDVNFIVYGDTSLGLDDAALAAAEGASDNVKAHTDIRLRRTADAAKLVTSDDHFARALIALRGGDYAGELTERDALAKTHDADKVELAYLDGARAAELKDPDGSLKAFAAGYALDRAAYIGDPRSHWWAPIDEAYGAELLRTNHPADAERVFSEELKRFPHDPRLLFGLVTARSALGVDDATDRAEMLRLWHGIGAITIDDLG